jgi:hypothetical protein
VEAAVVAEQELVLEVVAALLKTRMLEYTVAGAAAAFCTVSTSAIPSPPAIRAVMIANSFFITLFPPLNSWRTQMLPMWN